MEVLEVDLLEVWLRCEQSAACCCGWRVTGGGRGEGHIPVLPLCVQSCPWGCLLPPICLCLFSVQYLLFWGSLAEAEPYATVSYCGSVMEIRKKNDCAINGMRKKCA